MQIYTFFLKYNALWQAIVRFFQSTGIDRTENTAKWHNCRLNTDMQAKIMNCALCIVNSAFKREQ